MKPARIDTVTDGSRRVDGPTVPFDGRGWGHVGWWLFAWNAVVPIRLLGGAPYPFGFGKYVWPMILDHTSWAIATYVMFRLALRARHRPLRQVVTLLGVLILPLLWLRYWGPASIGAALGWPGPPRLRALLVNGPLYLLPLVAAAALGLLVVYMQRERDNAVLQAKLQAELASALQTQLKALRAQLQPHFLFNALNGISEMVHLDPKAAERMVLSLAEILRLHLATSDTHEVRLEQELSIARAYIEVERMRYGDALAVEYDVTAGLDDALLPPFILQPLIENAITHGLRQRGSVVVRLDVTCPDGMLRLAVVDTAAHAPLAGAERTTAGRQHGFGIGLANTRERLHHLYGTDHSLTVAITPDRAEVLLTIPLRRGSPRRLDGAPARGA